MYEINESEIYEMQKIETARIIKALRKRGWNDTEICDFILEIETGEQNDEPVSDTSSSIAET